MRNADERELVRRSAEGDHGAYRMLVERHMKQAFAIARGFTRDRDAAEDIAQEAFIRAYRSLPSFRGDADFSTWLFRIVTNLSLNAVKTETVRRALLAPVEQLQNVPPAGDADDGQGEWEFREAFERALHELPSLQRAVVILRHLEGLSTRQVSTILRCSEGTVKTHLFRAMKKLRSGLQNVRSDA